jgi:hypothetical protein
MLRDWSVDSIVGARTATPVNVVYSRNIGFGAYSFRPDLVPDVPLYLDDPTVAGGKRFNPAAFSIPTDPRQGTLPRNALRGFPLFQLDLALRRQIRIAEGYALQLRADGFNILNHPNFGSPVGALTSGTFGRSTTMLNNSLGSGGANGGFSPVYQVGGPRSIQLAVKLLF